MPGDLPPAAFRAATRPSPLLRQPTHALYRAQQVRAIDAAAIAAGTPGFTLMQRAGAALLDHLLLRWPACRQLVIFVGGGNNGGDGYVLAQLAAEQGIAVRLLRLVAEDQLQGDAALAASAARAPRIERFDWDTRVAAELLQRATPAITVVVDAMLGTGVSGALRAPFAEAVSLINAAGLPVLAVDVPTGLDSDSGAVTGDEAVMATMTLTFIALKRGLVTGRGPACCGRLHFARLQVDDACYAAAQVGPAGGCRLAFPDLKPLLAQRRARDAHKGDFGHVLVIGGDHGFGGAALMAAEAAARAGAGTVTLVTRERHVSAALARCPALMVQAEDTAGSVGATRLPQLLEDWLTPRSVVVLGPGLGRSAWGRAWVQTVLRRQQRTALPLVLDADALNLLASDAGLCADLPLPHPYWLLTPHPGEAARLLGTDVAAVEADRCAAVSALQQRWGGLCLLKGAGTLMADSEGALDVCVDGNPGMATGGMGDILAGLLGGLMAQAPGYGWSASDVQRLAVCLHAASADEVVGRCGEMSLLPTDLLPAAGRLLHAATAELS